MTYPGSTEVALEQGELQIPKILTPSKETCEKIVDVVRCVYTYSRTRGCCFAGIEESKRCRQSDLSRRCVTIQLIKHYSRVILLILISFICDPQTVSSTTNTLPKEPGTEQPMRSETLVALPLTHFFRVNYQSLNVNPAEAPKLF